MPRRSAYHKKLTDWKLIQSVISFAPIPGYSFTPTQSTRPLCPPGISFIAKRDHLQHMNVNGLFANSVYKKGDADCPPALGAFLISS